MRASDSQRDFFISYNTADRAWAEWIAWELEEEGYTTILQDWDFRPGQNFIIRMSQAAKQAQRTIAILSPDYIGADYTQPEWAAAFARDPTGEKGLLVPVRVRECDLQGLLPQVIYIDLVGLEQQTARERLLFGVLRGRAKPMEKPVFPGIIPRSVTERPMFPGREKSPIRKRQVRNKLLLFISVGIIVFVALILLLLRTSNPDSVGPERKDIPKTKVVLVLCDVTGSLTESQSGRVAALAADIIDTLPGNSKYAVYPINEDSGRTPPLIPSGIIQKHNTPYGREKEERREEIESRINALHKSNGNHKTCILNMLWFAHERLTRMADLSIIDPSIFEFELYIISDMVENCDDTPLGPIKMEDSNNLVLIQLAANRFPQIPRAPDLSEVRISVIVPSTFESKDSSGSKPGSRYLKDFWRTIFMRCGLKEEWFWDHKHIDWISNGELPDRLRQQ